MRFASRLGAEHLNWHPAVHLRFGERLFYFLIRFDQPLRAPIAGRIEHLMRACDINNSCQYTIFGHWDALVRVWMTDSLRQRFITMMKNSRELGVLEVKNFETSELFYFWTGFDDDLYRSDSGTDFAIGGSRDQIRELAKASEPDARMIERLKAEDLVFVAPATDREAVKFYIVYQRIAGYEVSRDHETKVLHDFLGREKDFSRSSLYVGVGSLGDYLIRVVANSYNDVLRLTALLDVELKGLPLRSITLLIANSDAAESDNINQLNALTPEDELVARLLGEGGGELIAGLEKEQKDALRRIVEDILSIGGPRTNWDLAREVIVACTRNSSGLLTKSLAPLLEFEFLFREYLKRAWARGLGAEWRSAVKAAIAQSPSPVLRSLDLADIDQWSLGPLIDIAKSMADRQEIDALLRSELGDTWRAQAGAIQRVRNDLAHGRFRELERIDDFSGAWGTTLEQVLRAMNLYVTLDILAVNKFRVPNG